jgi:hypothetical protein
MDHRRLLRADCARCQALCCVALPFDRSEWFGFDKQADVPCRHLGLNEVCSIHEQLAARGQAGCASYDCYGAGQRITQELLPGLSWRASPQQARRLCAAFRQLKRVHELRFLLHEAESLKLGHVHAQRHAQLLRELEPEAVFDAETLAALDVAALESNVHALLRELRGYITAGRRLPLLPSRARLPRSPG